MEKTVEIPEGVTIELKETTLHVSCSDATLEKNFNHPRITLDVKDKVAIKTESVIKKDKAIVGTWAAHVTNMIKGVKDGFEYKLAVVSTHFPMTLKIENGYVIINNFMGGKGVKKVKIVGDVTIDIQKDTLSVSGINKEEVGQTAANIESACKRGKKDARIFQDGIYITQKA